MRKLLVVFLGLAFMVAVVGYIAIYTLKEISTGITQIRESSILELASSTEMDFQFRAMDNLFDEYIYETIEKNPIEVAIAKEKLEESFMSFENALRSRERVTEEGLKLYTGVDLAEESAELEEIKNLETKYFTYKSDALKSIAGYKHNGDLQVKEHRQNKFTQKNDTLLEQVKALKNISQEEINQETISVVNETERSINFLLLTAFLSLVIAIIAAISISKSIAIPLLKLNEAAKSIAGGNMVLIKDVKARGEIGNLAVSFNTMTLDLIKNRAQLEEYHTVLEQKVDNRTKELKEALSDLKMLFENVNEVLYSADMVSYKLTKMSDVCEKVYGYTAAEFLADSDLWQKVIHPEDKCIAEQGVLQLNKGKSVFNQYRIIHKDAGIRWLENKIIPTLDENGRLIRIDGVTSDITKRKQAEVELENTVSILEATLESTADGILVTDYNGKIVRFNNKFVELWGIPREILDKGDDEVALSFVSDQLLNSKEFISKVKEIYAKQNELSFDTLRFKDGRIVERYTQPQIINGNCAGQVISFHDITSSRKAEEKIKESELRYRSLVEQATDAICITDSHLKFIDINPSGCQAFGYSKEEVLQLSLVDLLFEEDLKTNPFRIEELKSGKTLRNQRRGKKKDGTSFEFEVSSKMLTDGRVLLLGSDITERKKGEEKIKESELRYRSLIEQATDAICVADGSLKIIEINSSACKAFGYSKEELLQLSLLDLLFIEEVRLDPIKIEDLKSGKTISNERRAKRKDGSAFEVDLTSKMLQDGRILLFGRDITDRKKAEAKLNNSEKQYRQIVETAEEGIVMLDENSNIIFANKKMGALLEYSQAELEGKSITCLMNEDSMAIVREQMVRRLEGINEPFDLKMVAKSGLNVWTSISSNLLIDDEGNYKGALAMLTDITLRKHNDELLRLSQADLLVNNIELEQKNKELEQFAYIASHDLQEPLRTISSFVGMLQDQYKEQLDETANQYLDYTMQTSERMRLLISDLLGHSRIGVKKELKQVDTNLMLQEVLVDVSAAVNESGAEISVGLLPVIDGYSTEIKQLFQNLISNSIKFRKKDVPLQIHIGSEMENNTWQFSVSDNGIGIEPQHHEKIFAIFQRLHNRKVYEGSGIGLSNCKKIVNLHKGKIWVESTPGTGSTFLFTLNAKPTDILKNKN